MNQEVQQSTQPISNDDKIAGFAKNVLTDLTGDREPNEIDTGLLEQQEAQDEPQAETQPEDAQPEAEEAQPEPSIPMVEVELEDGQKVQVPENIKGYLMRDKDYRQKTMALAEQRKAYEQLSQQAQQVAVQAQQMAPYHAQLMQMDSRAQFLQQNLTNELATNDPIEFNRMQGELAILLRNRDSLASGLHNEMSKLSQQQAYLRHQQLAIEAPKLFEQFPELQQEENRTNLAKYIRAEGANDWEYDYINFSPFATKLAWKAAQYDRLVKDQATAKATLKTKVASVPTVGKSTRSVDDATQSRQLKQEWRKDNGNRNSDAFSKLLRDRLGRFK